MPCAGKLGNCPQNLKRFHLTCLKCRQRWKYTGKWTNPPYWIEYAKIWHFKHTHRLNRVCVFILLIDPRGHLLQLRCAVIVALLRLAELLPMRLPNRCHCHRCYPDQSKIKVFRPRKYIASLCEFFACITI